MGIYLLIIVWLIICSALYRNAYVRSSYCNGAVMKWKWSYCFLASLPIFLIMALRAYNIGNDTIIYIRHFRNIQQYDVQTILSGELTLMGRNTMETGYLLFEKILGLISQKELFFMFIVNFILIGSVALFITRYSENPGLSLYLFFTIGLFSFMVTGIRQSIAMCIGLYALELAQKRKLIKFVGLVLLAMSFHKSAVVLFIIYFLVNQQLTIIKSFIIFLISLLGVLFFEPLHEFFSEKMGYEYDIESTGNGQIFLIIMLILLFLTLWKYKSNVIYNRAVTLLYNMQIVCTILWVLRLISRTVERPSYYFMFSIIILVPNALNRFTRKTNRLIITMAIIFLMGLLFIYRTVGNPMLSPYRFIWN